MMTNRVEKKLQVRNLRISFRTNDGKVQAVRDISFDLHKGETLAIVGESGSGKSVTSKAILGILAGNAIIEGGEILYDGQDLLKISEDDFYRLRGDKIAMIFQDPLSSLNPIMRIGKQLTEAMLLKGKARQRSCRDNFKTKLNLMEKYMAEANPSKADKAKAQCNTFRSFEAKHTALEQAYNNAYEAAQEALVELDNILHLIRHNALKDAGDLRQARDFALNALNPYVVADDQAAALKAAARGITANIKSQMKSGDFTECVRHLTALHGILSDAVKKDKPDFFAMGYFLTHGSGNAPQGTVEQNNKFYFDYMAKEYMDEFESDVTEAVIWNDQRFLKRREDVIAALQKALSELDGATIDQFKHTSEALCKLVQSSIDPLDIVKDSPACTFTGSIKSFINDYYTGLINN